MSDVVGSDDGVRLARVTYLFGAKPESEPTSSTGDEYPTGDEKAIADRKTIAVDDGAKVAVDGGAQVAVDGVDLPPKRLHNFPTGELERLTPAELQQRMDEITARGATPGGSASGDAGSGGAASGGDGPEFVVVEPETEGERSARAHNVSMHALTRRGVSSAEMTDLLRKRDLEPGDVAFEVTRLETVGLLNDAELAETLVMQMRERKGLGRTAITAELRRRKIDPEVIEVALDDAYESGDDDLTRARALALKRAPQLRSLDPETARRRLGAFLMRKGYSGSIVSSAVASALAPNHPSVRRPSAGGPRFE